MNWRSGIWAATSSLFQLSPGASVGTTNNEIWAFPVAGSTPVRATVSTAADSSMPEM